MKKNFSVTRVPFRVSLILSCLFFASLSAYAAPPQEVTIPCPDKDHTPIQMPTGQGNLLRAKGDLTPWKFALVPANNDVHVLITKDWKFSGQDAGGHVVDQGWGAFAGGGKTLSLSWNSALMPGTFTVTVSFKRWCGGANGPGVGPPADIPEETLEWGGSVLGIEILDVDRNVITTKQTVCVGQEIVLSAKILPNGVPNGLQATYKWTLPKTSFLYYDAGNLIESHPDNLNTDTTGFHFFDKGTSQAASVECTIGDQKLTASVQFDIQAPTMNEFKSTTGEVHVGLYRPTENQVRLLSGTAAAPGIKWTAKVTAPALIGGKFKFTQILTADNQITKADAANTTESYKVPAWWSDVNDPYNNLTYPIAASQQGIIEERTDDTPNWPLNQGYKKLEVKFQKFQLYLMFQPNGQGAMWVPVGKIEWGWKGVAESADGGINWTKTSGSFFKDDPTVVATNPTGVSIIGTQKLDFPQYSDTVVPGQKPTWVLDAQPNP